MHKKIYSASAVMFSLFLCAALMSAPLPALAARSAGTDSGSQSQEDASSSSSAEDSSQTDSSAASAQQESTETDSSASSADEAQESSTDTDSETASSEDAGSANSSGNVRTADGHVVNPSAAQKRLAEEVQSNQVDGWPQGPAVSAEGAILLDADTGAVLYSKNIHEHLYPASTTKMLTCLIAAENLKMDDTVTFSHDAISNVPADGSNIGMNEGDTITVEQCLYGILVGSANECANAIAEKVAGSVSAFTDLMNKRAKELGCTDSHFANANGLFLENHYTSPHDLAMIARAFFNNQYLITIGNTPRYHFVSDDGKKDFYIDNTHSLINGQVSCPGVIGGKTGYTDQSGRTLVTGCERNGMRLICVVMKEDDPQQYTDTVSLFDYGYTNFQQVNIAENDTSFQSDSAAFLNGGDDILGSSSPAFYIQEDALASLPDDASFSDLNASLGDGNVITYTYGKGEDTSVTVGTAKLLVNTDFKDLAVTQTANQGLLHRIRNIYIGIGSGGTIYIHTIPIAMTLAVLAGIIAAVFSLIRLLQSYNYSFIHQDRRRRARRSRSEHTDYYENHKYDHTYDETDDFSDSSWNDRD
ncbi:MAG: D-alanyl-D-alanine carboxypeptidase [Lachnospiraceae bacterium]|nr:D-alanyl-D-alanine carboxypeptidase [Lachnospiraceae bacterium]